MLRFWIDFEDLIKNKKTQTYHKIQVVREPEQNKSNRNLECNGVIQDYYYSFFLMTVFKQKLDMH